MAVSVVLGLYRNGMASEGSNEASRYGQERKGTRRQQRSGLVTSETDSGCGSVGRVDRLGEDGVGRERQLRLKRGSIGRARRGIDEHGLAVMERVGWKGPDGGIGSYGECGLVRRHRLVSVR